MRFESKESPLDSRGENPVFAFYLIPNDPFLVYGYNQLDGLRDFVASGNFKQFIPFFPT